MSHIEVSRKITRRVRGLHLAVLINNKHWYYHGSENIVRMAVGLAEAGHYSAARRTLVEARERWRKSPVRKGIANTAYGKFGNPAEALRDMAVIMGKDTGLQVDHAAFDKASDACAAPKTEVSVEAMTSLAPVTLRFTPAGAKLLGLDGRATTKYVEVSMAKASAVVLRNKLYSLRRAPGLNQLKTIDAALTVLDAAGIN